IGVNGFDNPMRDPKTEEVKKLVGLGVKVKMDDQGNILVKRLSGKNVYVKSISNAGEETSIGADVLKLPNYCLENDKPVKVSVLQ
ncbi:Dwarfin sma-2, partial [Aphis craccivora]